MKLKIAITVSIILVFIIAIIASSIIYFYTGNINSKIPEFILKECNVKNEKYQNRNVFIITSKEETQNKQVIFYLHGGSYVAELSEAHWKFLSKLVQDTKVTLVVPDYPLTPQYQYTDTFQMVDPLYKQITEKVKKENLIVMGDSAGGGMALALMEKISQEKLEMPSKTILISPWIDVSMRNPEIKNVQEKDKMLNQDLLKMAGVSYAGSEEATIEYLVSPIYGPLENLENVIIYTGTNDILNPDVHLLVEKAQKSKVEIQVKETKEAVHNWIINKYQDKKYDNELAKNAYEDLIKEIIEMEK